MIDPQNRMASQRAPEKPVTFLLLFPYRSFNGPHEEYTQARYPSLVANCDPSKRLSRDFPALRPVETVRQTPTSLCCSRRGAAANCDDSDSRKPSRPLGFLARDRKISTCPAHSSSHHHRQYFSYLRNQPKRFNETSLANRRNHLQHRTNPLRPFFVWRGC